jgi:DNA-binding NarL/FixJ family response regulator
MTKEQAIKVLIVDDHGLMREGLAAMLRGNDQFAVVGLLSSGEDAVNQVSDIMPQVILMDILLRGMTGIEATRWIKDQHPEIKIILISMEMNKDNISLGIKSGIDGFLPKDAKVEELTGAIFSVMRGERYFSSEVRALVFEDFYLK